MNLKAYNVNTGKEIVKETMKDLEGAILCNWKKGDSIEIYENGRLARKVTLK